MKTITNSMDFKKFKKYCDEYIVGHRLGDWMVQYDHADLGKDLSCVVFETKQRIAKIKLNTKWDCEVTDRNIREVALHEVLHLALSRLMDLAESRFTVSLDSLGDSEHDVIDRIIFAQFGDIYNLSNVEE